MGFDKLIADVIITIICYLLILKLGLKNTAGFNKKGLITHENENYPAYYYSTENTTKLLRGVYIDNNLYTVSEDKIKVNDLDTLKLLSELNIKGDE